MLADLEQEGAARGAFALVTDTDAPDVGSGRRVGPPIWLPKWRMPQEIGKAWRRSRRVVTA
ncbi:hypothetical protein Ait01nite_026090 [Actinoplanes italicus]|uniref:hypothetical protein n=1 Tax=Actinoplanes italicus TaxID=113567 RepID=UPI000D04D3C5|nr:hypothetical protein [Actinoplanes italicus]GIE29564.1 hypothetical protein Ait01nite_026090 [Actinoplanes italicus]